MFGLPDTEHVSQNVVAALHRGLRAVRPARSAPAPEASASVAVAPSGATLRVDRAVLPRGEIIGTLKPYLNARAALFAWRYYSEGLGWVAQAHALGQSLARQVPYDVIITSGPPHLSSDAARRLSVEFGVPLVLDFRDPWAALDLLPTDLASPLWYGIAEYYERKAVRQASLLTMNTERATRQMQRKYPKAHVVTVRNGYDGGVALAEHDASTFVMVYAGAIYLDRDPRPTLAALRTVIADGNIPPGAIRLKFIGETATFAGVPLTQLAAEAGVEAYVQVMPSIPRDQLHAELRRAAMLVNLPQGASLCIPSKVFEYLHFPAWLLALEPAGTSTHDLLATTGADIAAPTDVSAIAGIIRRRYNEYMGGARPVPLAQGDAFTASRQAEVFFRALEAL